MPDDALHTTPRDLTPEEMRALIVETRPTGRQLMQLTAKFTEGEMKTFHHLMGDREFMDAMGGQMGAPMLLSPVGVGAGLSKLAGASKTIGPLMGRLGAWLEGAGGATVSKVPVTPSALPAAKSTISNLSRVDTSALPSIEGAGGVSVEGPGLLTTLLGALGLSGASSAEPSGLHKRKAY